MRAEQARFGLNQLSRWIDNERADLHLTWTAISQEVGVATSSRTVGRLVGEDAGAGMSVVCDLGDPRAVGELLREAGFEEVQVDQPVVTVSHRDVRATAAGQLAALPSGSAIDGLSREQHTELVELMCGLLANYIDTAGRLNVTSTCDFACGVSPARTK